VYVFFRIRPRHPSDGRVLECDWLVPVPILTPIYITVWHVEAFGVF